MKWTIERKHRNRQIRLWRRICKKASLFALEFFIDRVDSLPEYYGERLNPNDFPVYKKGKSKRRKDPKKMWIADKAAGVMERARAIGWDVLLPQLHNNAMRARTRRIQQYIERGGIVHPVPLFEDDNESI